MKQTVVISFGDSVRYRVPAIESSEKDLDLVKKEVETYLKATFPADGSFPYYSAMTVERVPADEAAGYPEFNADAMKSIEKTLRTEVRDARSLDELNLNAPFSDIN